MNSKDKMTLSQLIQSGYTNCTGLMVYKDDAVVYEEYFGGYGENDVVHIASVTKSIVSILFGIALEKGHIKSLNEKVISYFPDYIVGDDEHHIKDVTLKDMLTMTAPYKYKSEPFEAFFKSDNWVKMALDQLGGRKVDGQFTYAAIVGTQILSAVLSKATQMSALAFANLHLFGPLEMKVEAVKIDSEANYKAFFEQRTTSGWATDPGGHQTAGFGLMLTLNEMIKLGQLCLNEGLWHGQKIVSKTWLEESVKTHSMCDKLPYGYLWWLIKDDAYAAIGDGGNVIYIHPKKHMVIAMTGTSMKKSKDRIRLIKEFIEPMLF